MVATGLLILEVNLSTMCELGSGGVSIISMAERTLGKPGTRFAWCAYVVRRCRLPLSNPR
jgi:tyrosine-specific transport protein